MSVHYITFRSVTTAQRGERVLKKGGIRCLLRRTPRWMEEKGCGYCLQLQGGETEAAVRLLRGNQIAFRKVYLQRSEGDVEEVTL